MNGIEVKGILLNNYNETDIMEKDNKVQIENLSGYKVIAEVKQDEDDLKIDKDRLVSLFKEV